MKKIIGVLFTVCLVFAFAGCKSTPPSSAGIPPTIANARRNAPEDVLVGIGDAKLNTVALSRSIAATRARAEISNSMDSMVKNMIRDYTAASEVDPNAAISFQEIMIANLSKSNLTGAVITDEVPDNNGEWWVVVQLSKENVAKEISQAQAAARLAVPAMASFDAESRMNDAFEQAKKEDR